MRLLNNRQGNNNRRRGRNNNQRPQGNGQSRSGENGSRIDNRARGNAPQLLEKYRALARDAQMAGDRVLTEYYHQFADHYFRVVAETRARFEDNRRPRDDWDGSEADDLAADARHSYDDGDDEDIPERNFNDNRPQPAREEREPRYESQPRGRAPSTSNGQPLSDERPRPAASTWETRAETAPREEAQPRNERPQRRSRFATANAESNAEAEPSRVDSEVPLTLDITVLPPAIALNSDVDAPTVTDLIAAPAPKKRGRPRKAITESPEG